MLTQNAVSNLELFWKTISGISSASKRSSVIAAEKITPQAINFLA